MTQESQLDALTLQREVERWRHKLEQIETEWERLGSQVSQIKSTIAALEQLVPVYGPPEQGTFHPQEVVSDGPSDRANRFRGMSYGQMLRILASEGGGQLRVKEAVEKIRDGGGAGSSTDLRSTLTTQLARMPKHFHRVGPGLWELLTP